MTPHLSLTPPPDDGPNEHSVAQRRHELGTLDKSELVARLDNLHRKLDSLPVIEQAKGLLIGRYGIDPDAAFNLLQRWSSHSNRKVRDIARLLVDTAASGDANRHRPRRALTDLLDELNAAAKPPSEHYLPSLRRTP